MNIDNPKYFFNREWSWLNFNKRVLFEASEEQNPLLERLKFLAIVSSNLEEFFMVRVAALKKQKAAGSKGSSIDKKTPEEQLAGIRIEVNKMLKEQYSLFYKTIVPKLKEHHVELLLDMKSLQSYKNTLSYFFDSNIQAVLTPISVGPTHPFPKLVSGQLYIAVELKPNKDSNDKIEKSRLSFIQVPINIHGRFIRLEEQETYIPIENIIKLFVDRLYNGYDIISASIIRITRDADFSINSDAASDLLTAIESNIKRLHQRSVVKLEMESDISPTVLKTLTAKMELNDDNIYPLKGILNLKDLFEIFGKVNKPDLKDAPIKHIYPYDFNGKDIFKLIRENDRILYHPYYSYDPIIELVKKAAEDERVLAIKVTLYRTSSNSAVIKALIKAAENGKYVTILDELKARFDEKRNIQSAKRLEDAGAHVIYGIAEMKTHCKALMIVRREKGGIRRYVHLATGNYNETTARLYTDLSFFTSDEYIGEDVSTLFNLLTGFSLPTKWNYLTAAPLDLRNKFMSLITRETENARNGCKARIVAKINSLLDKNLILALYEASNTGVKIDLIVRGICALRPGLKGVSENITVRSIIGKFLEHARIYYFYNSGNEEYYLSSADWMTRNLDKRVELLFPIRGKNEQTFIKKILDTQFEDNTNTWRLQSNGVYEMIEGKRKKNSFAIIEAYIKKLESSKKAADEKAGKVFKPVKSVDKK